MKPSLSLPPLTLPTSVAPPQRPDFDLVSTCFGPGFRLSAPNHDDTGAESPPLGSEAWEKWGRGQVLLGWPCSSSNKRFANILSSATGAQNILLIFAGCLEPHPSGPPLANPQTQEDDPCSTSFPDTRGSLSRWKGICPVSQKTVSDGILIPEFWAEAHGLLSLLSREGYSICHNKKDSLAVMSH